MYTRTLFSQLRGSSPPPLHFHEKPGKRAALTLASIAVEIILITTSRSPVARAKPIILLAQSYGRLGNRLWTMANLLAFAIEKGLTFLAPPYSDEIKSPSLKQTPCLNGWAQKIAELGYRLNLKLPLFPTLLLKEGELLELDSDCDFEGLARSSVSCSYQDFISRRLQAPAPPKGDYRHSRACIRSAGFAAARHPR